MNGAKKQKAVNQTIYSFLFLDECGDVIRTGFEPTTDSLEGCCSIQLSYRTIFKMRCKDRKKLLKTMAHYHFK